ncbi:MAG: YggS family pyridoxal phosphate-dependent enzyme [Candidatus Promineifilaceae bacterium]|jgi:pyridoxal phosphate enzyme (YggS family)
MSERLEKEIAARLSDVQERIDQSADRAGRDPAEITLVSVTKTWPVEVLTAAYNIGVRNVGENRAEELARKRVALQETLPSDDPLIWHQIGTLQSRKTALVAENADFFHALDRVKIANRLSSQLVEIGRELPVLLEVNLSGEASKSGLNANNWEESATQQAELRKVIQNVAELPALQLQGLMTMAPWDVEEPVIRTVFQRTRLLRDWLVEELPGLKLPHLSMGMTDDFEIAVEEGATMVRIGRAIFGTRQTT